MEKKKKLTLKTDLRPYVPVFKDFLCSDLLNTPHQKLLFICLKAFTDSQSQCFPSIKTLAKMTNMSVRKIKSTLLELEEKNVLTISKRTRPDGSQTSNLYTLRDFEELWKSKDKIEVIVAVNQFKEEQYILYLEAHGFEVRKKELADAPTKECITQAPEPILNSTTTKKESQVKFERYSLNDIRKFYEYEAMINENPFQKMEIDSVLDLLYDTLNTTKPTVRIYGEDKPTMVVISKLMKLDKDTIMYAIEKYCKKTERIRHPKAYMLSILYTAPEQFTLDICNQVSSDRVNNVDPEHE